MMTLRIKNIVCDTSIQTRFGIINIIKAHEKDLGLEIEMRVNKMISSLIYAKVW